MSVACRCARVIVEHACSVCFRERTLQHGVPPGLSLIGWIQAHVACRMRRATGGTLPHLYGEGALLAR